MTTSTKPQLITLRAVVKAARKALNEGTLGALKNECGCQYEYADGSRCVIGAAMARRTIDAVREANANGQYVCNLDGDIVRFRAGERESLSELPNAHDDWGGDYALGDSRRRNCKRTFLRKLARYERKLGIV